MPLPPPTRILVVDDDHAHARTVARVLERAGHGADVAHDGESALRSVRANPPALVVTDLLMPGISGLELLHALKQDHPDLDVLLMTAFATVERAVEAMRAGASDFIAKPIDRRQLLDAVARRMRRHQLAAENAALRAELAHRDTPSPLIGTSALFQRTLALARQAADSSATVLLLGESGTGKELFAREIHRSSPFRDGPFVPVHIGALAESVLESELFGHEAGAFTGARARRIGCFERAGGGTLFLDEIGELTPHVQVRLLRVLEEAAIVRVGGSQPVPIRVRVVAATHRDLPAMVRAGTFRADLWYRLHVLPIELPALRDRLEDVPALVHATLRRLGHAGPVRARALDALRRHPWPGNVRELINTLERAVVLDRDGVLDLDDLPPELTAAASTPAPDTPTPDSDDHVVLPVGTPLAEAERRLILATLHRYGGDKAEAARVLEIGRRTIYRKLAEWNTPRDE